MVAAAWPAVRFAAGDSPASSGRLRRPARRCGRDGASRRRRAAAPSPSARSGSTITTTSRRATSSARSSRRSSASPSSASCRSSFTRAKRPTTRSPCCGKPGTGVRGVMHCFSGTLDEARRALDLGFYISLSGIVTFPKAEHSARRRAVRPGGSPARRDRRAVSGAGAAPRQAQRAGLGGRDADGARGRARDDG